MGNRVGLGADKRRARTWLWLRVVDIVVDTLFEAKSKPQVTILIGDAALSLESSPRCSPIPRWVFRGRREALKCRDEGLELGLRKKMKSF